MKDKLALRRLAIGASLFVLAPLVAQAQTSATKPPPRLQPNVSTGIPAGVDSGTPATSDSMQLGTPVPPAVNDSRNSAAARAAARSGPRAPLSPASAASAPASGAAEQKASPAKPAKPASRPTP